MAETIKLGVMLCYNNQFKIGASKETATFIADCENVAPEFEVETKTWNPHDTKGSTRRVQVVTGMKVPVNAKRNIGDTGNDFVASKAGKNGSEAEAYFAYFSLDGKVYELLNALVQVTNIGTGNATDVAPLVFTVYSNGIVNQYASVEEYEAASAE